MTTTEERLSERAYQALRADIMLCRLTPGQRVSEALLAERLGFGKAPVRTALARLCQEGLMAARARSGFTVAPITPEDIMHCFQVRLALEPMAARLAAGRLTAAHVRRLVRATTITVEADDPDQHRKILEADQDFHETIAEASGNPRLQQILQNLYERGQRPLYMGIPQSEGAEAYRAGSQPVLAALIAGEGEKAAQLLYEHVYTGQAFVIEAVLRQYPSPDEDGVD
ncbi:GntR family transcriptional regulator [Azospirillum sp. B4]|uniref:GntR family transcriptional regulator n=1 Tax=Azospirillum sp. B4 TaxID=95605 RepID=UPI000349F4E6|nr:GntR family transcriptional regulator [Azospirillum sp. B4]